MTLRALFAALALTVAAPAQAADPPPPPAAVPAPADAAAIALEPGTAVEIACDTKAVVVAEGAPAATQGAVRFTLERTAGLAADGTGRWMPGSADPGHSGSFTARERARCATGCPLTLAPNGEIQLWAPAAKSLDAVKEGETLLLAIIRADRALRASTFRGQSIEALEEGRCRKVTP